MRRTTTDFYFALTLAAGILLLSGLAQAGPPFLTDDPEPVELHHWELYLSSTYALTHAGSSAAAPLVEVNYGALPNLQLHAIASSALDHPNGGPTDYGFGDTELGIKYRFLEETNHLPMAGIFPLVELPTGSASHGLGNGKAQYFIPLWLQKSFDVGGGEWTTYGGGGYWFNEARVGKDHIFVGWELQRKINDHLALGGEIFYQGADTEGTKPHLGFNIGPMIDLDDHNHILFSIGRDFAGDSRLQNYLGYQLTF